MARLSIRIDLDEDGRFGPGKALLLERVGEHRSISAAGRSMGMSYRRAWELVAEINGSFREPLVTARAGGRQGGGATLTPLGLALVRHYRAIERAAAEAGEPHLSALQEAAGGRGSAGSSAQADPTA